MMQTQNESTPNAFSSKAPKPKTLPLKRLPTLKNNQIRNFLKKKQINKKRTPTVNIPKPNAHAAPPSPKTQKPELFDLLNESKCTCPLCLEILVKPILLQCGHILCLQCFEEYSNFALRCSICRTQLTSPIQIEYKALDEWIKRKVQPNSEEGIEYWCRQGQFDEWQQKRRVNPWNLKPGDQIDFWTIKGWHPAAFKALFCNKNNELMLKVVMKINGQLLVEIQLLAYSRKLAPAGFFTKGLFTEARSSNRIKKFIEIAQIPQLPSFLDQDQSLLQFQPFPFQTISSPFFQPPSPIQTQTIAQHSSRQFSLQLFQFQMNKTSQLFLQ